MMSRDYPHYYLIPFISLKTCNIKDERILIALPSLFVLCRAEYPKQLKSIELRLINIFFFSGSCEHATFPCGTGNSFKCVPQHFICDRIDACREDYRAMCGLFYGHTDYIETMTNGTDIDVTSVNSSDYGEDEQGPSYDCGKSKKKEKIFCSQFNIFIFFFHRIF